VALFAFLNAPEPPLDEDPLGLRAVHRALASQLTGGISGAPAAAHDLCLLVAAAHLAPPGGRSPLAHRQAVRAAISAAERFAALAHASADPGPGAEALCAARAHLTARSPGATHVDARFRQPASASLESHAETAAALGLLDLCQMRPTRSRGEPLVSIFLEESCAPAELGAALRDPERPVLIAALAQWGARLMAPPGPRTTAALAAALSSHLARTQLARALRNAPATPDPEPLRLASAIARPDPTLAHARAAALRVLAFERIHRLVRLVLERTAFLIATAGEQGLAISPAHHAAGPAGPHARDPVLARAGDDLPPAIDALLDALGEAAGDAPFADLTAFLADLRPLCATADALVDAILARHRAASRRAGSAGWFAARPDGSLTLRAGAPLRCDEVALAAEIAPHRYGLDTLADLAGPREDR
jgi:hypothetical protein